MVFRRQRWLLSCALVVATGCGGTNDPDPTDSGDTSDSEDTSDSGDTSPPTQVRFNWFNPHGGDKNDAWADTSTWPEVLSQTDAISWYIDSADEDARGHVTEGAQFVFAHDIQVAIEAGGTLTSQGCDENTGENSAASEIAKLHVFYEEGGQVDHLSLDGPLSRTLATGRNGNCGFDLPTAVQELVDYFVAVHATHPEIQIGLLTNFPNWTYGGIASYQCATKDFGDYEVALESVISALAAVGEKPAYVMADNPYDYLVGRRESNCHDDPASVDWAGRLVDLEHQVQGHGIPFAVIYNSAQGGGISNELFHDQTLAMVEAYQAAGGNPDVRHVESWYDYPDDALPETEEDTFMNTVRDAYSTMTARLEDASDR